MKQSVLAFFPIVLLIGACSSHDIHVQLLDEESLIAIPSSSFSIPLNIGDTVVIQQTTYSYMSESLFEIHGKYVEDSMPEHKWTEGRLIKKKGGSHTSTTLVAYLPAIVVKL